MKFVLCIHNWLSVVASMDPAKGPSRFSKLESTISTLDSTAETPGVPAMLVFYENVTFFILQLEFRIKAVPPPIHVLFVNTVLSIVEFFYSPPSLRYIADPRRLTSLF